MGQNFISYGTFYGPKLEFVDINQKAILLINFNSHQVTTRGNRGKAILQTVFLCLALQLKEEYSYQCFIRSVCPSNFREWTSIDSFGHVFDNHGD
jgi:hypothetical protein